MNIHQRLLKVMEEVTYIQKDTEVRVKAGQTYKAVSHDAVTSKVRKSLITQGVIVQTDQVSFSEERYEAQRKGYTALVHRATVCLEMSFINATDPKDRVTIKTWGTGEDTGDKAVGMAVSYAAKYGILKMLMLETGDDPDKTASQENIVPKLTKEQKDSLRNAFKVAEKAVGRDKAMELLCFASEKVVANPAQVPVDRYEDVLKTLMNAGGDNV